MRYAFLQAIFFVFGFQAGYASAPDRSAEAATLSAWIEQVRPELETTLGYSLPKLPLIQAANLSRQPDPDVAACVKWRWPHLKDDALARALEDAGEVTATATVARLVEGTNVILVRPENQKSIAGWSKELEKADSGDFFRLALIHETVRYVLDSRYDLAKLREA